MKKRLLWISDVPYITTGMGIVTKETLKLLKSKYDVAVAAWNIEHSTNYTGKILEGEEYQFKCFSIRKDCKEEFDDVKRTIENFKPHVIVCFGDQWNFGYLPNIYQHFPNIHVICYTNVDSGPVSNNVTNHYKFFDRIIASSEYAKKEFKKVMPTRNIEVAYHGINSDIHYSLNKIQAKQMNNIGQETFVIGYIARNQVRKNIPTMLKIYSEFQKDKDDVLFILQTDIDNPTNTNVNLTSLIQRYIPKNKIKVVNSRPSSGLKNNEMNILYNSLDVYSSTSYAEGQGMPIMEAMATGAIPVVPYAYCMEEIAKAGILVPIKNTIVLEAERNFSCVDEEMFLKALNYLYYLKKENPNKFNEISNKNIEVSFEFDWINLAKKIDEEINTSFAEGKDTCITSSVFG